VKDAFALQIKLELGNRCKFSVAVFKSKNLVVKWCFRLDRFVSRIRSIHEIFRWLVEFWRIVSSSMDEDILIKFAGLMHHRIHFIGIL